MYNLLNNRIYQLSPGPEHEEGDSRFTPFLGRSYMFKMTDSEKVDGDKDRQQRMELMAASKEFTIGLKLNMHPRIRYPIATHRVEGRMWPGEDRRKIRKAGERKNTRRDVNTLCKYLIFKHGKFVPGKMV